MAPCSIEAAVEDIRNGRMVILMDDEDRENEGDLTMAAGMITPQQFTERKLSCDSRYRSIVGQLDVMIELVSEEPGRNLTLELDHLLDAMVDHIDSENSYMEVVGFPQAVQHHLHHQFICINTAELRHRFSKGQDVLLEELTYIRLLWMEHIHVHDRAFEEYLAS